MQAFKQIAVNELLTVTETLQKFTGSGGPELVLRGSRERKHSNNACTEILMHHILIGKYENYD